MLSCAVCWLSSTVVSQLLCVVSRCLQVSGPGEGWPSPLLRASSRQRGVCRAASPLAAPLGQVGCPALPGSFLSSFPSRARWGPLLHPRPGQVGLFQKSCHAAVPTAGHRGSLAASASRPGRVQLWLAWSPTSDAMPWGRGLQLSQVGASLSPSHTKWDARDSPPILGGRLWLWSCPPRARWFVLQNRPQPVLFVLSILFLLK